MTAKRRIGLIALAVVVTVIGGIWLYKYPFRSADVTLEKPPCQTCTTIYSATDSIPTIGICELINKRPVYENQVVRLRAVFVHDAAQTFLRAHQGECPQVHSSMKTGLDARSEACDGARKALTIYSGFEMWYDSQASVVVVGRLGRINNPHSFYHTDDGFNILCLEHVEPIGSGEAERRKYESWLTWWLSRKG